MLYRALLQHQWKWLIRNPSWTGLSIAYTILLGLLVLYFLLVFILLGIFLRDAITSQNAEVDIVRLVHQYFLGAFLVLLLIRFLFQNPPQIRLGPYLHLPMPRAVLIRFFALFALVHLQNLFPLAFLLPFWARNLALDYPASTSLSWLAGLIAVLGISNYLVLSARLAFAQRPSIAWLLGGGATALAGLDYWYKWGYTSALSSALFDSLLGPAGPVVALVLVLATALLFGLTCRLLGGQLHDESPPSELSATWGQGLLDRLDRLGPVGQLIALEIKLATRNRRTRQVAWSALIFLPMGLFYCLSPIYSGPPDAPVPIGSFMPVLGSLFISTGFLINYGQFMFGWESHYFDGHLARPVNFRRFLWAKLVLLQVSCLVLVLVALPVFLALGPRLIGMLGVLLLYNLGFSSACMLFFATLNTKRLEIASSSFFNQQGTSLHHLLVMVPLLAPPLLLLNILGDHGQLVLGGGGLLCWALSPVWVGLLARRLQKRKYRMAAGFRGTT